MHKMERKHLSSERMHKKMIITNYPRARDEVKIYSFEDNGNHFCQ